MCASFHTGTEIWGWDVLFEEKFWDWGLIFSRNSGNAEVWDDLEFSCCFVVITLVRNHIHFLGLGLKVPSKFLDLVMPEIL